MAQDLGEVGWGVVVRLREGIQGSIWRCDVGHSDVVKSRKHSCPAYERFLSDLNGEIGKTVEETIQMSRSGDWWRLDGTRPIRPSGWKELECVWEYEILGLWSVGGREGWWWGLVTMVTVSVIVLVVVILFLGLFIYAQRHRSKERKQLRNLLEQTEMVLFVCCMIDLGWYDSWV